MCINRFGVAASLFLSAGCAAPKLVNPDFAPPPPFTPPPVEQAVSVISVPITIPAAPVANAIERRFRQEIHPFRQRSAVTRWNEEDDRDWLRWAVRPAQDFRIDFNNSGLVVRGGLEYYLEFKDVLSGIPDIYAECPGNGTGGTWPRFRVRASTPIGLDADWEPILRPRLEQLDDYSNQSRDRCNVDLPLGIRIGIRGKILENLRPRVVAALDRLTNRVQDVPIRTAAARLWTRAHEPFQIGEDTWLVLNPQSIAVSQPFGANGSVPVGVQDGNLHFTVNLTAKPRIVVGPRPPTQPERPLPPLQSTNAGSQISLMVDALLPVGEMSSRLNEVVAGRTVRVAGREVQLTSAEVLGVASDTMYLKVGFTSGRRASGTLYLRGRPTYNAVTGILRVEDVDYDLRTRNVLLQVADWLLGSQVREYFSSHASWNLQPRVTVVRNQLNAQMTREVARGIHLDGRFADLQPVGVGCRLRARSFGYRPPGRPRFAWTPRRSTGGSAYSSLTEPLLQYRIRPSLCGVRERWLNPLGRVTHRLPYYAG